MVSIQKQRKSYKSVILKIVIETPGFDATNKFDLCEDILSRYPNIVVPDNYGCGKRGWINHLIERAIRIKERK